MTDPPADRPVRHTFGKRLHLRTPAEFDRVYQARAARRVGPFRVHAIPNALGHHRLGLSVGRRAGNAVVRNRVKRMVREAFRLDRPDLPGAYDLVVVAFAHEPLHLDDYRRLLATAVGKLDREWKRRDERERDDNAVADHDA